MKKLQIQIIAFLISLLISAFAGASDMQAKAQGALDHFVFNDINSIQTAGTSFNVTITVKDSLGNTVTSYNGTPTLTYSAGSISPSSAAGGFSAGVWTGAVTVTVAGSVVTISATDGSCSGTSNSLTVNPVITVTQSIDGVITPGTTTVNYGANQSFTITPYNDYYIETLIVDGSSVAVPYTYGLSYNFSHVQACHSITATFTLINIPSQTMVITSQTPTPTATLNPRSTTSAGSTPSPTQIQKQSQGLPQEAVYGISVALIAVVIAAAVIIPRKARARRDCAALNALVEKKCFY